MNNNELAESQVQNIKDEAELHEGNVRVCMCVRVCARVCVCARNNFVNVLRKYLNMSREHWAPEKSTH